jgi:hypothetical protein
VVRRRARRAVGRVVRLMGDDRKGPRVGGRMGHHKAGRRT